ncbi:FadR family transcriptional regulator [Shimazuella sp. AN120528]|uniref:FadR/GntR family transcriptional regulator n=1 Tax=Shimazuella soli TaxID=1892854 RepID=UPI001F0E53D0|nr:FadR/GntR family transcriptional regulator [Shimazuella soli]MCH5583684.1 FadR family transcriptional regulator [Shimazuella soli]
MNSKISFHAINRSKLVDDVVNQLQKKISDEDIQIGDKIPTEPELMEQFNVGRSTVREAVRVLVHAGLLEKRQGFGTYLIANLGTQEPFSQRLRRAEILEVYEVRRMLELEMSRFAAMRRDDHDLTSMREALDRRISALKKGDRNEYIHADVSFHLAIARASKNSVAIDLFQSFSSVLSETLQKLAEESADDSQRQHHIHENIYQAILQKDEDSAVQWTLENLDKTVVKLKALLK